MANTTSDKDKAFLQSYLEKLNADEEEEEDDELIRNIKADLDTENNEANKQNNRVLIMGTDGRYYYQTSEEGVYVETVKPSPMKKIAGTIVTPAAKKRKRAGKKIYICRN